MEPRKAEEIIPKPLAECHGGVGTLMCKSLLENLGSEGLDLMHRDDIPAGVSIGFHEHTANEEVYYLASGKGILTYDGKEHEMNAGDISLCKKGHSHAFSAQVDCVMIVVASKEL